MKITIGHLFYDIMNLYGEVGNVIALKNALEQQNIEVEIQNISLKDNLDLQNIDFVYIGCGTYKNITIVLEYLRKYQNIIIEAINNNKFFLVTGSAIELFGQKIINKDNETLGLGIFDYISEYSEKRLASETIFTHPDIPNELLGFQNQEGILKNNENNLFTIKKGISENSKDGIIKNNFFSTYIIGPILARNPELLEYICTKLIHSKEPNFVISPFDFELEIKAKENFKNTFLK